MKKKKKKKKKKYIWYKKNEGERERERERERESKGSLVCYTNSAVAPFTAKRFLQRKWEIFLQGWFLSVIVFIEISRTNGYLVGWEKRTPWEKFK